MIGLITPILMRMGAGITLNAGDGGSVSAVDGTSPYDSNVAIRFNTDGTVETGTSINGGAVSWSSAGRWYEGGTPGTPGNYSVRYTNRVIEDTTNHDFTTKAAAEDTWVDISSTRTWIWNDTSTYLLTDNSFTCDFEVRDDVGTLVTASTEWTFTMANTA